MATLTSEQMAALSAPFPIEAHTVREGFKNNGKTKIRWFVYVDVREVVKRLNAVLGSDWSTTKPDIVPISTGIIASIGITIGNETRWYTGGADFDVDYKTGAVNPSSDDGKGAVTDAIRRAASLWGVAEYIYAMELEIWTDAYEKNDWDKQKALKGEALKRFTDWYNKQFKAQQKPVSSAGIPTQPTTTQQPAQNGGNTASSPFGNRSQFKVNSFQVNLSKNGNKPYLVFTVGDNKEPAYLWTRQPFEGKGWDTATWKDVGYHELVPPALITCERNDDGKWQVKDAVAVDPFEEIGKPA